MSGAGGNVCGGILGEGPSLAPYCSTPTRTWHEEEWILRTVPRGQRLARYVSQAFARAHPGPALVMAQRMRLASPRQAAHILRNPHFNMSFYPSAPTVNGGVARYLDGRKYLQAWGSASTQFGLPKIRFFWASGPTVVIVDVRGAQLTTAEAQQIALLAHPR